MTDDQFNAIIRRLDGIDGRLDGIDGRLDGIDGRLDGIDGRLDEITTEMSLHRTALERFGIMRKIPTGSGSAPRLPMTAKGSESS